MEKDILFFEGIISDPLTEVPSDFCNLNTLQRKQKFRSLCRELLFLHGCIAVIHRHKMLNFQWLGCIKPTCSPYLHSKYHKEDYSKLMVRRVLKIHCTLHHYSTLGRNVLEEKLEFFTPTEAAKNNMGKKGKRVFCLEASS